MSLLISTARIAKNCPHGSASLLATPSQRQQPASACELHPPVHTTSSQEKGCETTRGPHSLYVHSVANFRGFTRAIDRGSSRGSSRGSGINRFERTGNVPPYLAVGLCSRDNSQSHRHCTLLSTLCEQLKEVHFLKPDSCIVALRAASCQ